MAKRIAIDTATSRILLIFSMILGALIPDIRGGININYHQSIIYDDNIFRNSILSTDMLYLYAIDLSYPFDFEKVNVSLGYNGGFYRYQDYNEHRFDINSFDAAFRIPIVGNLQSSTVFSLSENNHAEDHTIFDNENFRFSTILQLNLRDRFVQAAGFSYTDKDYENALELSFRESKFSINSRLFLESRTSLIMDLHFKRKTFSHDVFGFEKVLYKKNTGDGQYGKGPGPHGGYGSNNPYRADSVVVVTNISGPGVSQFILNLKIAQSITTSTGVSINFTRFFPASETTRYLTGQEYLYDFDNELYDDPYTFSSSGTQFTLTQLLPFDVKFDASVDYADKNYNYYVDSLSTAGQNRADTQWRYGVGLQKNFLIHKIIDEVGIRMDAIWINNISNEDYFDYEGFSVMTGIDVLF